MTHQELYEKYRRLDKKMRSIEEKLLHNVNNRHKIYNNFTTIPLYAICFVLAIPSIILLIPSALAYGIAFLNERLSSKIIRKLSSKKINQFKRVYESLHKKCNYEMIEAAKEKYSDNI